jgi:predicted RNase H-like nuclease (RuvC/YqgF family)
MSMKETETHVELGDTRLAFRNEFERFKTENEKLKRENHRLYVRNFELEAEISEMDEEVTDLKVRVARANFKSKDLDNHPDAGVV